jgi:hypothetical protein
MDDVAPLRQIAAGVTRASRPRTIEPASAAGLKPCATSEPCATSGIALASLQALSGAVPTVRTAAPVRAVIKPFDPQAGVVLFTPAVTYRTRYHAMSGRPDWPEYPPVGARIDYYLPAP